jgi:uncharacterized protein YjaG (DUF416 family)
LNDVKRLAFGIFLFERALPEFLKFQVDSLCSGGGILRAALARCWYVVEVGSGAPDVFVTREACEALMPDSEGESSLHTSSAIDAVNICCNLLCYLEDGDIEHLVEAAEARRDTADLLIQLTEKLDPNDDELESKILHNPLMQEELRAQHEDIEFLKTLADERSVVFAASLRRVLHFSEEEM